MKNYQPQGGDSAAEKLSNLHDSLREHQNNQNAMNSHQNPLIRAPGFPGLNLNLSSLLQGAAPNLLNPLYSQMQNSQVGKKVSFGPPILNGIELTIEHRKLGSY